MLPAMRRRLDAGVLAEEVVLLGRRQAGMRVGAADEAELERVDAELLLQLQAFLQRPPRIFPLDHAGLLRHAGEIGLIPFLELGELVGGRERGMRLAVTLDLGDLVHRLPARPRLGPFAGQRIAEERARARTSCRSTGCRYGEWPAASRRSSPPTPPSTSRDPRGSRCRRSSSAGPGRPFPCRRDRSRCGADCRRRRRCSSTRSR